MGDGQDSRANRQALRRNEKLVIPIFAVGAPLARPATSWGEGDRHSSPGRGDFSGKIRAVP